MTEALHHLATIAARTRGAGDVRPAGRGTEFAFFVSAGGEGYRVPRTDLFDTVNNPGISAQQLQRKEQVFTTWATEQDLPAAEVIDLVEIEGTPVLVVTVVPDDGSPLAGRAFGRVLARMHQAPVPSSLAQHKHDLADTIAMRLTRRHAALTKYGLKELPAPHRLAEIIRAGTGHSVVNSSSPGSRSTPRSRRTGWSSASWSPGTARRVGSSPITPTPGRYSAWMPR
jgi:hypothetical protein